MTIIKKHEKQFTACTNTKRDNTDIPVIKGRRETNYLPTVLLELPLYQGKKGESEYNLLRNWLRKYEQCNKSNFSLTFLTKPTSLVSLL